MSALVIDDPCIMFALGREAGPFRREFRPHLRFPGAPCWAKFCGPSWLPVLVMQTGDGLDQAQAAVDWALSEPRLDNLPYRPKLILFAGFGGALSDTLRVGDLVLADSVTDDECTTFATTWPGELPAGEWRPPLKRGRILTSTRLIGDPAEKKQLGAKHQAVAVDMESVVLAKHCARREIPFGVLRAISDDCDAAVSPGLFTVLSGGSVSIPKTLWALTRSPKLLPEMIRLAKHTRLAADNLAKGLGELLTLTLPWADQ